MMFVSDIPELVYEWSDKNTVCPENVSSGSNRMIIWRGRCGHEWTSSVKNRVHGSKCPYCSHRKVLKGFNDLMTLFPAVAYEWSEHNEEQPDEVSAKSNKSVWWKCSNGHEWRARIADRTDGHGCPFCAGKIMEGYNDLFSSRTDLVDEWSDRNNVDPHTVSENSTTLVWWKCRDCGCEWQAQVHTKVKGTKCPKCRKTEAEERYRRLLQERQEKRRLRYQTQLIIFEHYMNKVGIEYIKNDDSIIGLPLQYFIPERHLAVEFMMKDLKSDKHYMNEYVKNELCLRNGIKVVRVLGKESRAFKNCLCITKAEDSYECLAEVMQVLMDLMGVDVSIGVEDIK